MGPFIVLFRFQYRCAVLLMNKIVKNKGAVTNFKMKIYYSPVVKSQPGRIYLGIYLWGVYLWGVYLGSKLYLGGQSIL